MWTRKGRREKDRRISEFLDTDGDERLSINVRTKCRSCGLESSIDTKGKMDKLKNPPRYFARKEGNCDGGDGYKIFRHPKMWT